MGNILIPVEYVIILIMWFVSMLIIGGGWMLWQKYFNPIKAIEKLKVDENDIIVFVAKEDYEISEETENEIKNFFPHNKIMCISHLDIKIIGMKKLSVKEDMDETEFRRAAREPLREDSSPKSAKDESAATKLKIDSHAKEEMLLRAKYLRWMHS